MRRAVIIDAIRTPIGRAHPEKGIYRDVRADYLEVARARALRANLDNVTVRVVGAESPELPARAYDLIVLCQVDHYLRDRASYFAALARALRPGGRIALVNYARYRDHDLAAASAAKLVVVDEWNPSPPFFLLVLAAH